MANQSSNTPRHLRKQLLPFFLIIVLIGGIYSYTVINDDFQRYDLQPIQNEIGTIHSVKPGKWEMVDYNQEAFIISPGSESDLQITGSILPEEAIQYQYFMEAENYDDWIEKIGDGLGAVPFPFEELEEVNGKPIFYVDHNDEHLELITYKISNGFPLVIHLDARNDVGDLETLREQEFITIYKLVVENTSAQ